MRMTTALSLTPRCGIMGPNRPYSKAPGLHKGCLYVFAPTSPFYFPLLGVEAGIHQGSIFACQPHFLCRPVPPRTGTVDGVWGREWGWHRPRMEKAAHPRPRTSPDCGMAVPLKTDQHRLAQASSPVRLTVFGVDVR